LSAAIPVWDRSAGDILWLEEGGDAELRLRQAEGQRAISAPVPGVEPGQVHQAGLARLHQRAEGQPVTPRGRQVGDLDARALQSVEELRGGGRQGNCRHESL